METKLRKYKGFIISIAIYILLVVFTLQWLPRDFNKSFQGVLYQPNSNEIIKETIVSFEGSLVKPLIGKTIFKGALVIDGERHNIFDIPLDEIHRGYIHGLTSSGRSYSIGNIFFDENLNCFIITLYNKTGANSYGWSSEDGLTIAAPAKTREEAEELANKLMLWRP